MTTFITKEEREHQAAAYAREKEDCDLQKGLIEEHLAQLGADGPRNQREWYEGLLGELVVRDDAIVRQITLLRPMTRTRGQRRA